MKDKKMPKTGKTYYTISSGHILKGVHKHTWENSELDHARFNSENYFTSKKEADFIYKMFRGHY